MTALPEEKLRFNNIEAKIKEMDSKLSKLDDIGRKLDKITTIIVGDDLIEADKGFVGKVAALEKRFDDLEKLWNKVKYFVMGGMFFSGYGIYQLFKNIMLTGFLK